MRQARRIGRTSRGTVCSRTDEDECANNHPAREQVTSHQLHETRNVGERRSSGLLKGLSYSA